MDLLAAASSSDFERAIELVAADPEIDAVVAIYVPPLVTEPSDVVSAIARGASRMPAGKPIAAVSTQRR